MSGQLSTPGTAPPPGWEGETAVLGGPQGGGQHATPGQVPHDLGSQTHGPTQTQADTQGGGRGLLTPFTVSSEL